MLNTCFCCRHFIHKISFTQILKEKGARNLQKTKAPFRKPTHRWWHTGFVDRLVRTARTNHIPVKGKSVSCLTYCI